MTKASLSTIISFWCYVLILFATIARTEEAKSPATPTTTVFTEIAQAKEISDTIRYPGRVTSMVNAQAISDSDGLVAKILRDVGQKVRRGEPLIIVRNTDPVYQYAPLTIAAPASGILSTIDVAEGGRVTRGQKLATIIDPSRVRLEVEVAAIDVNAIQLGLAGSFTPTGTTLELPVKVTGMSPAIDPITGTARCDLSITPDKDGKLPDLIVGSLGKILFKVRTRTGIEVTEQAIVYKGRDPFIRVVEDNKKAVFVPVTTGRQQNGMVELASGLKDGSAIIVRASGFVADGEEVIVKNKDVADKASTPHKTDAQKTDKG